MDFYIVRHAVAEDHDLARWPDDSKRPLTKKGRKEFTRFLDLSELLPRRVGTLATRPFVRAEETARLMVEALGWPTPVRWTELEPDVSPLRELAHALKDEALAERVDGLEASLSNVPHAQRAHRDLLLVLDRRPSPPGSPG